MDQQNEKGEEDITKKPKKKQNDSKIKKFFFSFY